MAPLLPTRPVLSTPKYPGTADLVRVRAIACEVSSPLGEPWESGDCSHLPGLGLGQRYVLASKSAIASDTGEKKQAPGQGPSHANVQGWQVGAGLGPGPAPGREGKQQKNNRKQKGK